jgi:crotonobetainyl-CoA:carnitine CoA-transferase CaiB-like acyl-CoA transferase
VSGELQGVRVADFSAVVAGPYCTRLMARWGADVIKIEPPEGDHLRSLRPLRDGASAMFGALNAGKRSISLDLRTEAGKAAAGSIVAWADVVVENFRPQVMARFGLDYDTVSRERPEIVYVSISGYGQLGPWIRRPALAAIIHATSGHDLALMDYQTDMAQPPAAGIHVADVLSASLGLNGLLTALRARDVTGVGRHVDVSMLDSVLSLTTGEVMTAQFPGEFNLRGYPPARTNDGFVMIGAVSQRLFESLMRAIGRPELIEDPRFSVNSARWENAAALDAAIEEWTSQRSGDDCERILLEAGVPTSRYRTVAEQFDLEQTRARQTFATIEDSAGEYQMVDSPYHLRGPGEAFSAPDIAHVPSLGEHTRSVLTELLGAERTEQLIASHVAVDAAGPAAH